MLPLGLASVGAALATRHDVRLLLPDTRAYTGDDPWGELAGALAAEAPDLVGITAVTATLPAAARVAELVRAVRPDAPVVLGGVHATVAPAEALAAAPDVDLLVVGEGEETAVELVAALARAGTGRPFDPATVPGLAWRAPDGAQRRSSPRPVPADLDALPHPSRTGLVWPQDVQPALHQGLMTMRGCPYACLYCAVEVVGGRRPRFRSPESVAAEVAALREEHGVAGLFFHDPVFTLDRARTRALCERLVADGLATPFSCQTRADRIDPDLLATLAAAGCRHVLLGIESGVEETLRRIGKGMPLAAIAAAVAQVRAAGLRCTGFFMVGFPWEGEAEVRQTVDFALALGLDAIDLFAATPLPGSGLWALVEGRGQPAATDFRTAQVNLTALPDAAWRALFDDLKARVERYNRGPAGR